MYFHIDEENNDNQINIQLRAVQNMSLETASAFMEIIRATYTQVLEHASEDEKA